MILRPGPAGDKASLARFAAQVQAGIPVCGLAPVSTRGVYHIPMTHRIFIDGAVGTTGLQVRERLGEHPAVEAMILDDDKRKDSNARRAMLADCDMAILCLPDDAARESAAIAQDVGARVIDASTAHRTADDWTYGFAELHSGARGAIAESARISNPGCYPTGFLALARPLVDAGILSSDARLSVPAVSGYSGGGKELIARHDSGAMPPHGAYGLTLKHKHIPEMMKYAGIGTAPIFMPSVGAFYAGMLVHLPLHASQLKKSVGANDLMEIYGAHFDGSKFVRVEDGEKSASNGMIDAAALAGCDRLEIFVFADADADMFWLTARLDNLGKGASGAAVQNMNIALGIDETAGLSL